MSLFHETHYNNWFTHIPSHKYEQKMWQPLAFPTAQSINSSHAQWIYGIFGFVIKNSKKSLISWKSGQENLANYSTKRHSAKHHKCVRPIYLQTNKIKRSVPLVLLKPALQGYFDPVDSNMEEFYKTFNIIRILQLRRNLARTWNTHIRTTYRNIT